MFSIEFLLAVIVVVVVAQCWAENFSLWHFNVFQVNCKPKNRHCSHTKPLPLPAGSSLSLFPSSPALVEYLSHFYENNVLKILSKNFQIMFGFSGSICCCCCCLCLPVFGPKFAICSLSRGSSAAAL